MQSSWLSVEMKPTDSPVHCPGTSQVSLSEPVMRSEEYITKKEVDFKSDKRLMMLSQLQMHLKSEAD